MSDLALEQRIAKFMPPDAETEALLHECLNLLAYRSDRIAALEKERGEVPGWGWATDRIEALEARALPVELIEELSRWISCDIAEYEAADLLERIALVYERPAEVKP